MLVFELELLLVVLFVAVLLPVVLVCAETVKAMIVLFIEYLAGLVKRR